jgi:hypothetical protein
MDHPDFGHIHILVTLNIHSTPLQVCLSGS